MQTSKFLKFRAYYTQIRQYNRPKFTNKSSIKNTLKPVKSEIRSSKPINDNSKFKSHKAIKVFDPELGINTSILHKFEDSNVNDEELESYEDYYDEVANNPTSFYDLYKTEEAHRQEMIKQKTLERKYFKKPKESALITWAAREQIYYLNTSDPVEWTPRKLSESFPITEEGVKKLLKSHSRFNNGSGNRKERYDQMVAKNWKLLESGKLTNVDPKFLQMYHEGKISPNMAQPNSNLPQVVPDKKPTEVKITPSGEFRSLIQPYLDMKSEARSSEKDAMALVTITSSKSEDSPPKSTFNKRYQLSEEDDTLRYRGRANVTSEQFKDSFRKNDRDRIALEWVEEECREVESHERVDSKTNYTSDTTSEPSFSQHIEKYNQPVELTVDADGNTYLYKPTTSYQHPMGTKNDFRDKIIIPRDLRREGALYKVNDCFYSDDGEFLYRVTMD